VKSLHIAEYTLIIFTQVREEYLTFSQERTDSVVVVRDLNVPASLSSGDGTGRHRLGTKRSPNVDMTLQQAASN
jgi:hypothetical protein